jgi:exopolysaccharide biosynthesis polyprenyl glycosylphosphotransferase
VFRRHLLRDVGRVVVLVASDLGVFLALREAVRMIRDAGLLGPGLAQWFRQTVPQGTLGGWQYAIALLVGLAFVGTYGRGDGRRDLSRVFTGVMLATALTMWHTLWVGGVLPFIMGLSCTVVVVWSGVALERLAINELVARWFPQTRQRERVLFVGDPTAGVSARVQRKLVDIERMTPIGWIAPNGGPPTAGVLGSAGDIWSVLHRLPVDTVVLCGRLNDETFETVVDAATAAGCRVLAVSRNEGMGGLRPGLVWHRGLPFIELTVPSLKARQLIIKRVIDLIGAAIGLLLLSPLFALIAVAIKLDSRGPVFFTQERVGFGGKVFRFVKFRTMRNGADDEKPSVAHLNYTGDPRLFKIPNDPRITRLGVLLRRWSLDELPQLWNVLRGDMSLVGPRPFFEADLAAYRDHHFTRLGAKPGITGLWQVNGRSSVVDFEEVVRLDREYIDQWSLVLDLKILSKTLPAVVRRTGAF